jgi:hypothetical protein
MRTFINKAEVYIVVQKGVKTYDYARSRSRRLGQKQMRPYIADRNERTSCYL